MKALLILISILFLLNLNAGAEQAYIQVGDAKSRKSMLAFPLLNNINGSTTGAVTVAASEVYTTAKKNFELSTYFNFLSPQSFLEDPAKTDIKPVGSSVNGFKFEPLKTAGAEFLIRSGFTVTGTEMSVEMYLYHVRDQKLIVGKRYKAKLEQAKQIGHEISMDVIESLTGLKPPFKSKIVVAFDRGVGGSKEIATMNWDGSDFKTVTSHKSIAMSPSWSPDGKKIAYSVFTKLVKSNGEKVSNVSLYVLDLVTNKRSLTSFRPGVNSGAVFSKDGKFIYLGMSLGSGAADIYKLNLSGEIESRLTKGPAGAINVEPTLSPDNNHIAFSSERGGRPMIYSMTTEGTNVVRLTYKGVYNSSPSWSPDGKKIAFAGQDDKNFDIFIMNVDGSGIRRVTEARKSNGRSANNEDPSFSPDGKYLVYTSDRTGKNQIFISNLDGTEERRVTNDSNNYYRPKWSVNLE